MKRGVTLGHQETVGSAGLDATQMSRRSESLIRLECQLRLNGYDAEADHLGVEIRGSDHEVLKQLFNIGIALGLRPKTKILSKATVP